MVTLNLTAREYADLLASLDASINRLLVTTKRRSKLLGRYRRLRGSKFKAKVVRRDP
jgi:hypothetical protein